MAEEGKRVIFFVEFAGGACARYRAYLPAQGLNERGWFCRTSAQWDPKMLDEFDIFVFQRINQKEGILLIDALREQRGRPKLTIYDIDDNLLHVPTTSPVHNVMLEHPEMVGNQMLAMAKCHVVTVTTGALKEAYQGVNPVVEILPNLVRMKSWDGLRAFRYGRPDDVVFGWGGSNTHKDALQMLKEPLQEVFTKYKNTFFVIQGDELPFRFPIDRYVVVPWGKYRLFQSVSLGWDVGMAPLGETEFNKCKSNLRILEIASAGKACIASRYGEYKDIIEEEVDGLLCSDFGEWYAAMCRLVEEEEFRASLAGNLRRKVASKWDLYTGIDAYEEFYTQKWEELVGSK